MASDAIGGSITFSTAIDNSDLEKGLEEATERVEELKKKIEEKEAEKSAIEQQMEGAQAALAEASAKADELRERMEYLQSIDVTNEQWTVAQMEIEGLTEKLREAEAEEDRLAAEDDGLAQKWQEASNAVDGYKEQLTSAEQTQETLAQRVSSFYYQAGKAMQSSMDSVAESVSRIGQRISNLMTSALVFGVLRQGLNALKKGIGEALMQNDQFSASWTYLTSAAQGFANGIANTIAPVVVQVINGVTACVMSLARAIDSVFHTSIGKSISAAQKSAQEAWRQTDESKAAQKQAAANEKARQKQQEQYAKAQERYQEQQRKAAERAAKAQESLDKRRAAAEQKYPDALADAAERQAKAEQDAAEKMAEAQQTAQERMSKAQEKAQERQQKAEESAAKRLEKAQQAAQARMTAAEQSNADKQQAAADRLAKAQEKAAQRQVKAEASAAERLAQAQETAAERRASAEQANAERQQAADDRLAKAQAKAAERLAKAEATAAQRNADAQAAYEEKVAAAQAKEAANKAKFDEKQAKAAQKLEKAQKKANETVLGFDELNKMNADSSEEAAQATEDLAEYKSTLADIKPPKTYSVDPSDYMVNPSDYAAKLKEIKDYSVDASKYQIDPSDYMVDPSDYEAKLKEIDPSDYFVDPSEYQIDPSDYIIDPSDYAVDADKYQIDPEDFFVDPSDYEFDPSEYVIDPEDYAVDPFSFDWQEIPEIGAEEGLKPNWDSFDVGKIDAKMAEITAILAGAKLAIGAILAFSGINVPLGIALMALGAVEMATIVAENWEKLPQEVRDKITTAFVVEGIIAIVLGAILAFSGVNVPLGVGLMAHGLVNEWTAVALNWASMSPELQGAVDTLMGILSGAFFVIGVILILADPDPTHKALGVGLMVLGAAGMAASIALIWNSLEPELQSAFTQLMVIVGLFAIVIGVVLLLAVPGMQALGVGLILTGVAFLGAAVALNWEQLGETVRPALETALKVIGWFCIVIGVILMFVPGQQALGVGLIIGGIAALGASEIVADWELLNGQISQKLGEVLKTISIVMLVLGVVLLFVPGQQALGVGLIIGGIAVLAASEFALNREQLQTDLAGTLGQIAQTLATYMLIFGVILMFIPGQQGIATGLILGGIALLAAKEVAFNWEQLQTDLIGTLSKIGTELAAYMLVIGVFLLFVPTARALGIGLIIGGIALLAVSEAALEWENTGDLESALDRMAQVIAGFMLVIGVLLLFVPMARTIGIGLIVGGIALLAVQAMDLDFTSMDTVLSSALDGLLKVISPMMAVIGVIMMVASGGTLAPLALGLIVGGVAIFAATQVAEQWEGLNGKIGPILETISKTIATALFVIGVIILIASGGTLAPIALGLMAAGAAAYATAEAVDWDFLAKKVSEIWEGIKTWWQNGPAKIFTVDWWANLFNCIPEAIGQAINGAIEAWNNFVGGIGDALGGLVGASGGDYGSTSTVSNVRPPGLARGAVIPPNRQFMAVLGDQTSGNNIETPESLMRQVVREEAGNMMAEMMMQMQAMGGGQETGGDTNLTLYIDSEELARATAKGTSSLTRRGVLSPSATFV